MVDPTKRVRNGRRRKLDAGLDEALAQTFPASDPFSVGQFTATEPPSQPVDRKAPKIDRDEVAAQQVREPGLIRQSSRSPANT